MRLRLARYLAGVMMAVALLSVAAGAAAALALDASLTYLIVLPAVAAFAISGYVLVVRVPGNRVGWLVLMATMGFNFLPWTVISAWLLVHHFVIGRATASLANSSWVLDVGGLALLLPLLFPDGRLPSPSRWWRFVLFVDIGYIVLASSNILLATTDDLPDYGRVKNIFAVPHLQPLVHVLLGMSLPMFLAGGLGTVTALVVRWRAANAETRAQIKWVVVALGIALVPFLLRGWWDAGSNAALAVALPLVPICIAISVLRYRLYEIDRIVSRAVSYLFVTALLVTVYISCVSVITTALPFSSSVGVAASTLATAALFQPIRRRVQRRVDRRFNRAHYDAERVIDAFAQRVRTTVDSGALTAELAAAVAKTVQPTTLAVWTPRSAE